jgi:hypothetical protein
MVIVVVVRFVSKIASKPMFASIVILTTLLLSSEKVAVADFVLAESLRKKNMPKQNPSTRAAWPFMRRFTARSSL